MSQIFGDVALALQALEESLQSEVCPKASNASNATRHLFLLNRDAVSTGFQCVSVRLMCCKEIRNLPWYGASIPTPMRQAAFAKLFLGDSWCVVF